MRPDLKPTIIILVITAVIIIAGLILSKGAGTAPTVTVQQDKLLATTTPMVVGRRAPLEDRVVIVEFGDLACPVCATLAPEMKQILAKYDGFVDFGLRLIPIHGEISIKSSIAAFAAGRQGRFFEMSDVLLAKQDEWTAAGANTVDLFKKYATEVGVKDIALFENDLNSEDFRKAIVDTIIARDQADANAMKINGTPTIIIDGETVIVGSRSAAALEEIIKAKFAAKGTDLTANPNGMPIGTSTATSTPKAR